MTQVGSKQSCIVRMNLKWSTDNPPYITYLLRNLLSLQVSRGSGSGGGGGGGGGGVA